ncbi:MAG: hypothetical protein IBJ03_09440 [Gemmatimonadaceae bacterium]|nr:hypothetical protein [Gemmatimonadaceae bacterium]
MSALPASSTPSFTSTHRAPAPVPAAVVAKVQAVVAGGRAASAPWATGIRALDKALSGGIPRGRVTEITGALAVGKTALLRRVAEAVLRTGSWVAWIDASRTLAPAALTGMGSRLVVIRLPHEKRHRAAWTADLLLRSGVFGLVVLDGAPALSRVHGVRLAQLARERDAACVVLEHGLVHTGTNTGRGRLAGTLRLRVATTHATSPRIRITVEKGGTGIPHQTIEVDRVIVMARRMCANSEIPDRRGVARSARRAWVARGNSTDQQPHTQDTGEHPVTWGGLGVAGHDLYGTNIPGHPARIAARLDTEPGDRITLPLSDRHAPNADRSINRDRDRAEQTSSRVPNCISGGLDRWSEHRIERREQSGVRDWTTYRGRRRAAESTFGRKPRPTSA